MSGFGRFGQQEDARNAVTSVEGRTQRLAAMASEPWPWFLLRIALSIAAVFVLGAIVVALFGR